MKIFDHNFKYQISRNKIRGKAGKNVRESCQMFAILYPYLIFFGYALIAKILLNKRGHRIVIQEKKQRSTTLAVLLL